MGTLNNQVTYFTSGTVKLEIHPIGKVRARQQRVPQRKSFAGLDQLGKDIGVIFATGASQFDTLEALTSIPGLPWNHVLGFHWMSMWDLRRTIQLLFATICARS